MGYADKTSAADSGQPNRTLPGARRYAGANANVHVALRRPVEPEPSSTIRAVLERWSVESFQRQRAALEQSRKSRQFSLADFVQALYQAEDASCRRMMAAAIHETTDPQELVRSLLAPAARLAGEDWVRDSADFLQVTIAMSRLQLLFNAACAASPPAAPVDTNQRILLAAAPGNQHGFGLAVIEDLFRRDGWSVDGGTESTEGLLALAAANPYRIIGLSVGAERDLEALGAFVRTLKQRSRHRGMVLMGGGCMAARDPQALLAAGFDLVPADAGMALQQASAIIGARRAGPS